MMTGRLVAARRNARVLLVAAVGVLGATGLAMAAIPGSDGLLRACSSKSTGDLRLVDGDTGSCKNNETQVSWNQTGPQGPQGDPGPAGGLNAVRTVFVDTPTDSGDFKSDFVPCPEGHVVVSGGATPFGPSGPAPSRAIALHHSMPLSAGQEAWFASAIETEPVEADWFLRIFAVCADTGP